MVKIVLIFLVVFCVVQLTLAARVVRQTAPEAGTFDGAIDSIRKTLEGTFTQENMDKMKKTISDATDQMAQMAQDMAKKIQAAASPTPAP